VPELGTPEAAPALALPVEASISPAPDVERPPLDEPLKPEAPVDGLEPDEPWGLPAAALSPDEFPALPDPTPLEADPDAAPLPQAHKRSALAADAKRIRAMIAENGGGVTPAVLG